MIKKVYKSENKSVSQKSESMAEDESAMCKYALFSNSRGSSEAERVGAVGQPRLVCETGTGLQIAAR